MKKNLAVRLASLADVMAPLGGALLLPCFGTQPWPVPEDLFPGLEPKLKEWIAGQHFHGHAAHISLMPCDANAPFRCVALCGLGKKESVQTAGLFRALAAGVRAARKFHLAHLALALPPEDFELPWEQPRLAEVAVAAAHYGSYEFKRYKSSAAHKAPEESIQFNLIGTEPLSQDTHARMQQADIEGQTLAELRDCANLPANDAEPREIAAIARRLAKAAKLSFKQWTLAALKQLGCGAFHAVAKGSHAGACLLRLEYPGARRGLKPLVIVGKTLTFDSGGISLKQAKNMEWMKYDKCGGMTTLAVLLAAARLQLKRPVIAYLAVAENMPGGGATRPGDIVRARTGKTIEILNTDAEGRLVLADALSFAAEEKPMAIVDIATLTGAVLVALGHEATGVMGNQQPLVTELVQAGDRVGDRLWPLPLWQDYDEMLHSHFADLKNIGDGTAGTIAGGMFLKHFVPDTIPWAHLDIAGTAWLEKNKHESPAGATLAGARMLLEWLRLKES